MSVADQRPPFPGGFRLYLASQSPRRRELLDAVGVPYRVVPSRAEELSSGGDLAALAEANARLKVEEAVLPLGSEGAFVLGTDTLVGIDGEVLGKPADGEAARKMLLLLSGRTHQVASGVALARAEEQGLGVESGVTVTQVRFHPLGDAELEAYVASGEWEGKAGAYAIQGLAALFSNGIEGEYSNVVGLPLGLLAGLFRRFGFDLLRREWVAIGR